MREPKEVELEIAPMPHRLPDHFRAHALICFIALVLHRVMHMRLKAAGSNASLPGRRPARSEPW